MFSQTKGLPFTDTNVRKKALLRWRNENERRTDEAEQNGTKPDLLNPIGLHELRHTAISLWFASGVRREVCEDWAGHSSGKVTDIYRHLRPEVFDAELALVDAYLGETAKVAVVS